MDIFNLRSPVLSVDAIGDLDTTIVDGGSWQKEVYTYDSNGNASFSHYETYYFDDKTYYLIEEGTSNINPFSLSATDQDTESSDLTFGVGGTLFVEGIDIIGHFMVNDINEVRLIKAYNFQPYGDSYNRYELDVSVTDGRWWDTETLYFMITEADVVENTAPTDIALTLANGSLYGSNNKGLVDENTLGAVIGTLSTTDSDSGDVHSYSLTGVGSELFEVDDNQQLKLKSGVSTDYETQFSYTLTVTSSDSGELSRSEDFIVNVT